MNGRDIVLLPPGPARSPSQQTIEILRRPLQFLESCRKQLGSVFTVDLLRGGRFVFVSDPADIKRLFAADRSSSVARIGNLNPVLGPRSVLFQGGAEHLTRRKLMRPALHGDRLYEFADTIRALTLEHAHTWPTSGAFQLHSRMQDLALAVMMRVAFGTTAGTDEQELHDDLVALLAAAQSPATLTVRTGSNGTSAEGGLYAGLAEHVRRVDVGLQERVARYRAASDLEGRGDILSMLLLARFDDGEPMADDEIRDQMITLLLAGHETTATSLAWLFDLILHDPAVYERLRREVDDPASPYPSAVIQEAMRVRPVFPYVGRRIAEPLKAGSWTLPPDTGVMAAIALAHTRAEDFRDPYKFRPERFLDGKPDVFSWVPFGGGARRCLGAALAELEMEIILRTIVANVTLEAAADRENAVRRHITLAPENGTFVVLRSWEL